MHKFSVNFYSDSKGIEPVKDFLLGLDNKMRAKILSMISILQYNGYELREPYSKYLTDGIFELRAKVATDITRILYFFYGTTIVLTNGFVKKTNRTPAKEISKAKKFRTDCLRRMEENHGNKI